MKLILIRHPALAENISGRCIGQSDYAAATVSKRSLNYLATRVKSASNIYSSDLQRTHHLAVQLADLCHINCSIDGRLREVFFGEWENRTWADIQAKEEGSVKKWSDDFVHYPPPGGESLLQLSSRVSEWKNDMQLQHPDDTIAAVTHAGVIRALLCNALDMPLENAFRFCVDYLSCTIINYFPMVPPSIQMLNCL